VQHIELACEIRFCGRASVRTGRLRKAWEGAFGSLLTSDFLGSEIIPSFDGARLFRLFVTRKILHFNGSVEFVIYTMAERQGRSPIELLQRMAEPDRHEEPPKSRQERPQGRSRQVRVFISYKHADRKTVDDIRKHLGWLENAKQISIFDDRDIEAGEDWNERVGREEPPKRLSGSRFLDRSEF
jgi:hypothetical protein